MVLRRKENQHGYLMALSKMSLLLDVRYYIVGLFSFVSLVLFFPPVAAFSVFPFTGKEMEKGNRFFLLFTESVMLNVTVCIILRKPQSVSIDCI